MKIYNKKAKYNYKITKSFEAGLVLSGSEVKAFRKGRINLTNSYIKFIGHELYIINADFGGSTKSIKLLVHKKEIVSLLTKTKAKRLTLVALELYTTGHRIKVKVGLAKPKKKYQKKDKIKKRDLERESGVK